MEIKEIRVKEKPVKCLHCGFEPVSELLYGIQEIDENCKKILMTEEYF